MSFYCDDETTPCKGKQEWPELLSIKKKEWPELLGADGEFAAETIMKENPQITSVLQYVPGATLPGGFGQFFCCSRVWLSVDHIAEHNTDVNKIVAIPKVG